MKKILGLFVFAVLITGLAMVVSVHANNIQVGTPTLTGRDATDDYVFVQFDLSWDNSWRIGSGPSNWDAAWVFVKHKVSGEDWAHCSLSTTDSDHTAPTGSTIDTPSDGRGVFIYRSAVSSGSNTWNNVKLRWNYGTGVADDATVTVKVFAIEMVYVPEGTLNLNTTASENMSNEFFNDGGSTTQITSEDALLEGAIRWKKDGSSGGVGNDNGTSYGSDALGASYPKGYAAFYCMKYEVSQGQYADFLSTLTDDQDHNRYPEE